MNEDIIESNAWWTKEAMDKASLESDEMARHNIPKLRQKLYQLMFLGYFVPFVLNILPFLLGSSIFIWLLCHSLREYMTIYTYGCYTLVFSALMFSPVRAMWRTLTIKRPNPDGICLHREHEPQLWGQIDQWAREMGCPPIDTFYLSTEFNAFALQQQRNGFWGKWENVVCVGLPLMQTLSPEQIAAVIAHELGHLKHNDSQFSARVYGFTRLWQSIAESNEAGYCLRWFSKWYVPYLDIHMNALKRQQEREADRAASKTVASHLLAQALCRMYTSEVYLDKTFTPLMNERAKQERQPPSDFYESLEKVLRQEHHADSDALIAQEKALQEALEEEDNLLESHPCLKERLAILSATAAVPPPPALSAAEHFLKYRTDYLHTIGLLWKHDVRDGWIAYHELYEAALNHRRRYEAQQARGEDSTDIELCRMGDILDEYFPKEAESFYRRHENHPTFQYDAWFHLAGSLLCEGKEEGLLYAEKLVHRRPDRLYPLVPALKEFLKIHNDHPTARAYIQRAIGNEVNLPTKEAYAPQRAVSDQKITMEPEIKLQEIELQEVELIEIRKAA
jgi:Zn-dependent protease with chaperone function